MGAGSSNSRAEIIAELASSHGGDIVLACEMIHAAAEAGADTVKVQTYSLERLNPADPQAEWLRKAWLSREAHQALIECCNDAKVQFLSTPFDHSSFVMLRDLGLKRFKIASSEAHRTWWWVAQEALVSWPWGRKGANSRTSQAGTSILTTINGAVITHLTAIPLYPTPLECVSQATLLDGLSDHCEGTAACLYALARGAKVIEAHFTIPGARETKWDKSPAMIREIRQFADQVATMQTGVSTVFRERWNG
jgi:N,N'-diacetyllegionaminate synthase